MNSPDPPVDGSESPARSADAERVLAAVGMGVADRVKVLAFATLLLAGATGFALQPSFSGTWKLWACLAGPYVALGAFAIYALRRDKARLSELLSLRGGDTSIGIVMGMLMVGGAVFVLHRLAPAGSPASAWLFQIYAQVGDFQGSALLILMLVVVVLAEEIVWRGWILRELQIIAGKFAVPLCALLYALAQAPSLLALRDPNAGLNPLLMAGALVAGLCWGVLAVVVQRLAPVILSHLVFSYFLAAPIPAWLQL